MRLTARWTKAVLLFVSFALTMVMYLVVQSPPGSATINLVVHGDGLDHTLIFDAEGSGVPFEVTGPKDAIDSLVKNLKDNPSYVMAYTSLKTITPSRLVNGRFPVAPVQLVVRRPAGLDTDNLTFKQLQPLDAWVLKPKTSEAKIKVNFVNRSASEPKLSFDPDDFEVVPSKVTITGPPTIVDRAEPSVTINPEQVERIASVHVPLDLPAGVVSNPPVNNVEVRAARHERAAYVNVNFLGHVSSGYRVSNYYVVAQTGQSSTALIRGPASVVDKTPTIDATIDISGMAVGFTFQAKVNLPDRLELSEGPLKIRVDIEKISR